MIPELVWECLREAIWTAHKDSPLRQLYLDKNPDGPFHDTIAKMVRDESQIRGEIDALCRAFATKPEYTRPLESSIDWFYLRLFYAEECIRVVGASPFAPSRGKDIDQEEAFQFLLIHWWKYYGRLRWAESPIAPYEFDPVEK